MEKAALVIDMPEYCCNCPLYYWNGCRVLEAKEKLSGHIENPSTERLEECPLKQLPKKKTGFQYADGYDYADGWNECIDKILDT